MAVKHKGVLLTQVISKKSVKISKVNSSSPLLSFNKIFSSRQAFNAYWDGHVGGRKKRRE